MRALRGATATAVALSASFVIAVPAAHAVVPAAPQAAAAFQNAEGTYYPVTPSRILDTRSGNGAAKAPIGPGGVVHLKVAGRGGVPAAGVSAVVLNVTVTQPTSAGYLTVYPTGKSRPTASNLNFEKGWTGANFVTVPLGTNGQVDVYNFAGSTHVIADVSGFYAGPTTDVPNAYGVGGQYMPVAPQRLMDTREDGQGPLLGGWMITLGVEAGDWEPYITALAVNITAVSPTKSGFLTVWDGGDVMPTASTLNFTAGKIVPNLAVVPVAPCQDPVCAGDPSIGIYNSAGATHVVVDVVGFYHDAPGYGLRFRPITPTRIADTRSKLGAPAALGAGKTAKITAPAAIVNVDTFGLALNVTAVKPTSGTYLTVWPAGAPRPTASNLNPAKGQTIPNGVLTEINDAYAFNVYNAYGTTDVVIDVAGAFDLYPSSGATATAGAGIRAGNGPVLRTPSLVGSSTGARPRG
ncbi:hypothetical protein [Rhizomonospora bruguierae]|uniref:hypothetical protein n=1 Tax=Rhizomonospora bruguierae TaxID=1581705 RepID=UPI001BCE11B2|nr:hypothetical protein [Micromonospora sp. NBRC 107566]